MTRGQTHDEIAIRADAVRLVQPFTQNEKCLKGVLVGDAPNGGATVTASDGHTLAITPEQREQAYAEMKES